MSQLIGLHNGGFLAPVLFAQIILVYFLLFFTVSIRDLTPAPWVPKSIPFWKWATRENLQPIAQTVCRIIAALSYIGVMSGATFSLAGISLADAWKMDTTGRGLNSLGVVFRTTMGTIALFHCLGAMWMLALMKAKERRQHEA